MANVIKLANPRGRFVDVDESDVPNLLKRGWVYPSKKSKNVDYNPVYDRGKEFRSFDTKTIPPAATAPKVGDAIAVEEI